MITKSEEDYIKEIYSLQEELQTEVSTNIIAEKINAKASSVTDMLQKLARKKLLVYKKYKGVKLNSTGNKIALSIIRKHRLWETFLVKKLNFTWDEVHEIAEQLEHIHSDRLIKQLDEFLNFPIVDPHGHPIPNSKGEFEKIKTILLNQLKIGSQGIFVGVKDSSDTFLKYLSANNLSIGCKIRVIHKETFDNSLKIEIENKQFNISESVAKNLYLKN